MGTDFMRFYGKPEKPKTEEEDIPSCFGIQWEEDDYDCKNCALFDACKEKTMDNLASRNYQKPPPTSSSTSYTARPSYGSSYQNTYSRPIPSTNKVESRTSIKRPASIPDMPPGTEYC
jgi:hypothetical protein